MDKRLEAGADEEIRTADSYGSTLLMFNSHHLRIAAWLIFQGATDNDEGRVDPAVLKRVVPLRWVNRGFPVIRVSPISLRFFTRALRSQVGKLLPLVFLSP